MKRLVRFLLLLVAVAVVIGLLFRGGGAPEVEPGSVLALDVRGTYIDGPAPPLFARLTGAREVPLVQVLSQLAKAERDDRLAAVLLRVGPVEMGWAKAQELRAAIGRVREAGKKTVAYVEVEKFGANLEYFVASAAEEVWYAPGSRTPLVGLAADYLFLGGLWEKLGIEIEVEKIGRYKTAAEQIAGTEMSEANREMANWLLDSIERQFVEGVAEARGLTRAEVQEAIAAAPTGPAELAALGLADGERFESEILSALGDPPVVEGGPYAQVDPASLGFEPVARVALVYGSGAVVTGEGQQGPTGQMVLASGPVSKALIDASEDDSVDAIVFRIDSPGGSALASDLVWHAVRRARERKPVIASLSDVAASGGYYVAVGADAIVADPGTLTGSIGVFVLRPVLGGLFDKLGIGHETLTRGRHAELLSATEPLSPDTRERLAADVRNVYQLFVSRVAKGRALSEGEVDGVGRGRVWTGAQAAERGLVDELGGLHEALDRVRAALELDPEADVSLHPYPEPPTVWEQLAQLFQGGAVGAVRPELPLPRAARTLARWLAPLEPGSPVLLPPVAVEIR